MNISPPGLSSCQRSAQLTDILIRALKESKYDVICLPPVHPSRPNPRAFELISPAEGSPRFNVWIYLWDLSDTVASRPIAGKRRIQFSVLDPSGEALNNDGPTVLLGYDANLHMFVGLGAAKNRTAKSTRASSSRKTSRILLDETMLEDAHARGIAYRIHRSGEIVFGIRPEYLGPYVEFADQLHALGDEESVLDLLDKIGKRGRPGINVGGRQGTQTTGRTRSYGFREDVKNAYGKKCPLTGFGFPLDSHHIYPSSKTDSNDSVSNGIPLDPKFHRLFHLGMIYLVRDKDGRYSAKPNVRGYLINKVHKADYDQHCGFLNRPLLHLPEDEEDWPDHFMIRKSYKFFQIEEMKNEWPSDDEEKDWRMKTGVD